MVKWSQNQSLEVRQTIKGYAAHMIGDAVGFYKPPSASMITQSNGGYLSSGLTTPMGPVNWITMWPKMAATDSYLLVEGRAYNTTALPHAPISATVASFIANSTKRYAAMQPTNGSFPIYSHAQVSVCTLEWQSMVNRLYSYYVVGLPPSAMKPQLNYLVGEDWPSRFHRNAICAANATAFWWNALSTAHIDPPSAFQQTMQHIEELYQQGRCT